MMSAEPILVLMAALLGVLILVNRAFKQATQNQKPKHTHTVVRCPNCGRCLLCGQAI